MIKTPTNTNSSIRKPKKKDVEEEISGRRDTYGDLIIEYLLTYERQEVHRKVDTTRTRPILRRIK